MPLLTSQKALVTGAAGGIGQAIVETLRSAGASIALADTPSALEKLDHNNSATTASVRDNVVLPGDLTDAHYCDTLPKRAKEQLGGLDIVVNNAGIIRRGKITEASDEDFDLSMAINVEAPFRICRAAIPLMAKNNGGAIVNTASCWGLYPGPDHPVYVMSKAALASLTQCLGRDHAHQGIRVNAVCPNEVDTPMLRSGFETRGLETDTAIQDLDRSVPLGRIAKPQDIADVVLFLASDQSRYVCGALLEVNGGKPVS